MKCTRLRLFCLSALAGTALALLVPAPRAAVPAKIKLLIVDGQNNHNWQATTSSLKATLAATGRFEIDVSTSPPAKAAPADWQAWRPAFARYRVVVLDYNGQRWPDEVEKSFVSYVRGGGGVVSVHAANNSFEGWNAYDRMIGLGWRDKDYGDRLALDDVGKPVRTPKGEGPGAGHSNMHEFVITVRRPDHPIMKGLPLRWRHGKDELYHAQRGPAQDMTVLDSAHSDKSVGGTGAHEPMTWFIPFGKGKVVTTVLGHYGGHAPEMPSLQCVGFQTVVARAAEWAATGKVTMPVPANFPTAEKISLAVLP